MANWATWPNQTFAASVVRPSKPLGHGRNFDRRSNSPERQGRLFKTSGARPASRQSESGRSSKRSRERAIRALAVRRNRDSDLLGRLVDPSTSCAGCSARTVSGGSSATTSASSDITPTTGIPSGVRSDRRRIRRAGAGGESLRGAAGWFPASTLRIATRFGGS
jgi:hypothetical protein